jgi:hypothetical protein
MALPNFFLIGAAKSGTTSMWHMLRQHPQIYMSPVKEPNFFAADARPPRLGRADGGHWERISDLGTYERLFDGIDGERIVGEASVAYLNSVEAPLALRRHCPDAKLVAVLRHPVARAHSQYLMNRAVGWEPLRSFRAALNAEDVRVSNGCSHIYQYRRRGMYAAQLEGYTAWFEADAIRVFLYEDLLGDPQKVMADIFAFLGVDTFTPDVSVRLNSVQAEGGQAVNRSPPRLGRRAPANLMTAVRPDIVSLQERLGRDLTTWLR